MWPLGISMNGANESTGLVNNRNSTVAELVYKWNVWETQTIVLLSFMLQLFLLATGSLRRRKTNGVLKALIWLAYLGADLVAVYALGLFSQYEDKYKLGRESYGDTLPFLWVPFLLVHLGGQDSITAFSMEDNNLWLRHLLNLATQAVLALYVFWKSFYRINYSILIPAMLVFVSGIIKYGERVWALKSASRNGLGKFVWFKTLGYRCNEHYALQIVLLARGLFVGRTVHQLGNETIHGKFVDTFVRTCREEKNRLKMVVMELGMMFDPLYSKANVLQRWTGVLFRCASQTAMVVAFLLFLLRSEKGAHRHNRVNVAITYTLFTGATFMEACSIAVVMASPWTRAHLREGSFLYCLSNSAASLFKAVQCKCNKRHRSSISSSMGLFNFMDYTMAMKYKPTILSKAICAIGLDKQWRNYTGRAGERIISGVMGILQRSIVVPDEGFRPVRIGFIPVRLGIGFNYTLSLPFEQVLYRLHIHTDWYISRHFANTNTNDVAIMQLKEECETLSNYMMYLMVVYPSMLPVSTAVEDLQPALLKWVTNKYRDSGRARAKPKILEEINDESGGDPLPPVDLSKKKILEDYTHDEIGPDIVDYYPFNSELITESFSHLKEPLEEIKAIWLRLLMYAAGKCSGEVHARQLGEGGELITFVWLLMVHHGLGDVAKELSLLPSDEPYVDRPRYRPQYGGFVISNIHDAQPRPRLSLYAFELGQQAETSGDREQTELKHD